jgi:hypothetical protein
MLVYFCVVLTLSTYSKWEKLILEIVSCRFYSRFCSDLSLHQLNTFYGPQSHTNTGIKVLHLFTNLLDLIYQDKYTCYLEAILNNKIGSVM